MLINYRLKSWINSSFRVILLILLAIVLISNCLNFSLIKKAHADAQSSSTGEVTVSIENLGDTGGYSHFDYRSGRCEKAKTASIDNGDSITLHLEVYTAGLNSKNLIVPVSIRYGNTYIGMDQILNFASVHEVNSEYKRLMGQNFTYLTLSDVKSCIGSIKINIGAFNSTNSKIYVTWQEVSAVYRLYNKVTSEHLFTTSYDEYYKWVNKCENNEDNWIGEGVSWLAPTSGKRVYRLYNEALGAMGRSSHYYTSDVEEVKRLVNFYGWKDDGEENGFMSGGNSAIYTCYNENLGSAHHYTSSKTEWQNLDRHGWDLEKDKNSSNGVFQSVIKTSYGAELSDNSSGPYPYWLAPASSIISGSYGSNIIAPMNNTNYISPETGIVMTNSQIQSDVEILREGSKHKSYAAVKSKWDSYLKNDNYHLYTKVTNNGNPNDYVEFRLVQVGAHQANGKSDGSVLTFQATHALIHKYSIKKNMSTEGGYSNTEMRKELNSGKIFKAFSAAFTNDIKTVKKYSNRGGTIATGMDYSVASSDEKLWIMSLSELNSNFTEEVAVKGYKNEGDQYQFWKLKNLQTKNYPRNGILGGLCEERSLDFPSSGSSLFGRRSLLRTALSWRAFAVIESNGWLVNYFVNSVSGVINGGNITPCFCF